LRNNLLLRMGDDSWGGLVGVAGSGHSRVLKGRGNSGPHLLEIRG
jgi:hypothetical protein